MERIVVDAEGRALFAVEVEPAASPLRGVEEVASRTAQGVADVGEVIAQASRDILGKMQDGLGDILPHEVELQFGVTLRTDAAIPLVAKASGEATFTVRVCWKPSTSFGNTSVETVS